MFDIESRFDALPINQVLLGNAIDVLKSLPDNSVDALISDPPGGLNFMSKEFDRDRGGMIPWVNWLSEIMSESLRVLKPGAIGLVWSIPRTCGWTQLALELAGFKIIDSCAILTGSGFPKGLDIDKALKKILQNEGAEKYNEIDKSISSLLQVCNRLNLVCIVDSFSRNHQKSDIHNGVKNYSALTIADLPPSQKQTQQGSIPATFADLSLQKKAIEIGTSTLKNDFAAKNAQEGLHPEKRLLPALVAVLKSLDLRHTPDQMSTAHENADLNSTPLLSLAINAELSLQNLNAPSLKDATDFIVQPSVNTLQCVKMRLRTAAEEVLKIENGKQKSSEEEATNALCAKAIYDLKRIILSQSSIFLSYDTTLQMECVSAISVTITRFMAECLTSNTEDIAERTSEFKKWDGWKSAQLKPSHEDWFIVQKPVEGTIARNILKWGVGGVNIEACRIGTTKHVPGSLGKTTNNVYGEGMGSYSQTGEESGHNPNIGRFPSNTILVCSPECEGETHARSCPVSILGEQGGERKSGGSIGAGKNIRKGLRGNDAPHKSPGTLPPDTGTAARYFKQLPHDPETFETFRYQTKASQRDRSCDGAVENTHPTVKNRSLMRYFCKLITPPGGVVLDPFGGSGSTAIGAIEEGFNYLLIEKEEEYHAIALDRIAAVQKPSSQLSLNVES